MFILSIPTMALILLYLFLMKNGPLTVKLSSQRKPFLDIVGLEVGAALSEGVPAVRLRKRENEIELLSAGFLKLQDALPETEDAAQQSHPIWLLPSQFQALHAALAVSSKQSFLRHASGSGDETPDKRQTAFRTVSRTAAPDLPPLVAGLPEFQAAWAARILPEGRKPTACSLQLSSAAALNGLTTAPAFLSAGGTVAALFVFPEYTALAAFQESRLVLYREHPVGYVHLRSAVSTQMGIDIALADSVLDDTLIDPTPIIEPVLRPLFRQVEISADFLSRRRNCKTTNFLLCGLPSGATYWSTVFSHMLNLPLIVCPTLDGVKRAVRATQKNAPPPLSKAQEQLLMVAYGAARAVLEDV